MLRQLAAKARASGLAGLCLNVRDNNPAIRLYERAGYIRALGSDVTNRVGCVSYGMVLRF